MRNQKIIYYYFESNIILHLFKYYFTNGGCFEKYFRSNFV